MRKNQISLHINRFSNGVPKGYPEDRQIINIYVDSNNLFAEPSEAFAIGINVVEEWQSVAVRCDITTNADDSITSRMLARGYNENYHLEYTNDRLEMNKTPRTY